MARRSKTSQIHESLQPLAVPLKELSLHPDNERTHDDRNLDTIAESLRKHGQVKPIIANQDGVIIAGNGTYEAIRTRLQWGEVAVLFVDGDADEQESLRVIDNRSAELAGWDNSKLADTLERLKSRDYDLDSLGFNADELEDIKQRGLEAAKRFTSGSDVDDEDELTDDEPAGEESGADLVQDELPTRVKSRAKVGDVWVLGDHRLFCGDCTDEEGIGRLFGDRQADMVLTDPPYGVSYVGKTKDALEIENDSLNDQELKELMETVFALVFRFSREGAYWYASVPAGPPHLVFTEIWKSLGVLRQVLVWVKDAMVLGRSEYHYRHEPILFGWKPGDRRKNSDRTRTSVWEYGRPKANREHPTMKPVALWANAVFDGSDTGDIVFDPFCGSGTTIIACQQTGRRGFCSELSPKYADVILTRWEKFTGQKAVRESSSGKKARAAKK